MNQSPEMIPRPAWNRRSLLTVVLLWHGYAALTLAERYLAPGIVETFPVWKSAINLLARAWMWTGYTVVLGLLIAGPLALTSRISARMVLGHIFVFAAVQAVDASADWLRMTLAFGLDYSWQEVAGAQFMLNAGLYVVTVLGLYLWQHLSRSRRAELQTERLRALKSRAELDKLRMQLHPHFLFNTLHSISEVIHQDADLADRMCTRLGDLLRVALENRDRPEVSLADELRTLGIYVEIQQMRFGDRLVVRVDVPDWLLSESVPTLILQPLVENSIKHGLSLPDQVIEVRVAAEATEAWLRLEVSDSGAGEGSRAGTGVGLENLRKRLVGYYGDTGAVSLEQLSSGTRATVRLPRHARRQSQAGEVAGAY